MRCDEDAGAGDKVVPKIAALFLPEGIAHPGDVGVLVPHGWKIYCASAAACGVSKKSHLETTVKYSRTGPCNGLNAARGTTVRS